MFRVRRFAGVVPRQGEDVGRVEHAADVETVRVLVDFGVPLAVLFGVGTSVGGVWVRPKVRRLGGVVVEAAVGGRGALAGDGPGALVEPVVCLAGEDFEGGCELRVAGLEAAFGLGEEVAVYDGGLGDLGML